MAYVPPALRKKQQEAVANGASEAGDKSASPPSNGFQRERLPRAEDVHEHYWPLEPVADKDPPYIPVRSTLNSSASALDKLKYVMLFTDANPRWQAEHIIYVKTKLHMLPGSDKFAKAATRNELHAKSDDKAIESGSEEQQQPAPSTPEPTGASDSTHIPDNQMEPIAVFEQTGGVSRNAGFRFTGYHRIARLEFLEPQSADLARMLEQKFSIPDKHGRVKKQQRGSAAWKTSLEQRWAVVQLEKVDAEAEESLAAPVVKINEDREVGGDKKGENGPRKGVNEMLREMRLEAEAEAEAEAESTPP